MPGHSGDSEHVRRVCLVPAFMSDPPVRGRRSRLSQLRERNAINHRTLKGSDQPDDRTNDHKENPQSDDFKLRSNAGAAEATRAHR